MKHTTQKAKKRGRSRHSRRGFTLTELLVGSTVMLIIILATLALYVRSNQVAVDQNMYAELQHDVRSSMYFISRDIRMAGVGLPFEFSGYYFQGTDNEDQGGGTAVRPDRLMMLGNLEDPLSLPIQNYNGSSINLSVDDYSFEQHPYPDEYYDNKIVLILPNPSSLCRSGQVRQITHITHSTGGANEKVNFSPGLAPGINPPGGLSGTCTSSSDYDGGIVTFIDVKEFWLDVTGNYPGLTAGQNGYIGNGPGGILYMTFNSWHYPLAQNVENLQFEYNGDMDNDGRLDGFLPWQVNWTLDVDTVSRIRQIRVLVLGRTPRPFVTVSGQVPQNLYLYQRPPLSNDPAGVGQPDRHKRFLLESASNVRNLSMNLYNTGTR
jgi:prepilin-type N-terminal cleavage/methylation domain-containing protein